MIRNPYKGKFIVFEGLDGSGQSTQAELLFKYLKKQGKKVHLTAEPSNSLIGGLVRSQLQNHWQSNPECLQLLFTADRAFHLEKEIMPLLKNGVTVICARYILSTLAYGNVDIKDAKWLTAINEKFIYPDATFLLRVSPQICLRRIKKERFHEELFEKEEKLASILKDYLKFTKEFKNVHIIDGEQKINDVFNQVKALIQQYLLIKPWLS